MQMHFSNTTNTLPSFTDKQKLLNQSLSIHAVNKPEFAPLIFPIAYFLHPVINSTPCIPSLSWIPCDYPPGDDLICVGKAVNTTNLTPMYRSFYV